MKAYWVAQVNVNDNEQYQQYIDAAKEVFPKYNAKFIVRTESPEQLEGSAFMRHVIIEFDGIETALRCYHSQEYQYAKSLRAGCCDVIVNILPAL